MDMRMKFSLFIVWALSFIGYANAQTNTPFSKYGVIQNVQNYSSNPYWSPNAPYNQRMPTPVYAMGPDVGTDDCINMVSYLVASECAARNNCISTQLSDIRPAVMLQLTKLPNGNYASSCGGYIDTIYERYKNQNAIAAPSAGAAFPTATGAPSNDANSNYQIQNPFSPKLQQWQQDILDRKQELKNLQVANGVNSSHLVRTPEFPATYADLSFTERMENAAAGYEPYKDKRAYKEIEIEKMSAEELWCKQNDERHKKLVELLKKIKKCQGDKTPYAECTAVNEYNTL